MRCEAAAARGGDAVLGARDGDVAAVVAVAAHTSEAAGLDSRVHAPAAARAARSAKVGAEASCGGAGGPAVGLKVGMPRRRGGRRRCERRRRRGEHRQHGGRAHAAPERICVLTIRQLAGDGAKVFDVDGEDLLAIEDGFRRLEQLQARRRHDGGEREEHDPARAAEQAIEGANGGARDGARLEEARNRVVHKDL